MLRVRYERLRRSKTISTVASMVGTSSVQMSWIERGRLAPTPEQRDALVALYKMPASELFAPMPEPMGAEVTP